MSAKTRRSSDDDDHGDQIESSKTKYKGVRRRKWGKWVSEIRVPGSRERLWLGTYATPEGAAVAHDVAVFCLRRPATLDKLNFPDTLPSSYYLRLRQQDMSPRSVQATASEAGMAVDAQGRNKAKSSGGGDDDDGSNGGGEKCMWEESECYYGNNNNGDDNRREGDSLSISVEDYIVDI